MNIAMTSLMLFNRQFYVTITSTGSKLNEGLITTQQARSLQVV